MPDVGDVAAVRGDADPGREQVEEAWLVTGASANASRPVRCDIPFVGRCDERALLDSAINLVRAGHSGLVSIVGEPGSGKSRLADEIVTALKPEAIVIETACAPYGESSLWAPIRNGMTSLLSLDPEATPDDIRTRHRAALAATCGLWNPATNRSRR